MADIHDKKTRSFNMSRIRNKNTKPEEIVRKYLFTHGLRYRKNDKRYPGHPDIVLPKYKTVIFVHGCFWHMHDGCARATLPASNIEFWNKKLTANVERDAKEKSELEAMGWRVFIVWECQLKKATREQTLHNLYEQITNTSLPPFDQSL